MLLAEAQIRRLSLEDVQQMYAAGVLLEDERVELVDGVLVKLPTPSPPHSGAVAWLNRHFVLNAGDLEVRVQDTLLVEGGFFVPDLMVVDPLPRDRLPSTALLVIEVAVTTQRYDSGIKAERYSAAGIPEYWIVDVPARVVEVRRRPAGNGYAEITRYGDGDTISTPVADSPIEVSALLG